jgi:CCR4-NOT transcription complex subunit 7/8
MNSKGEFPKNSKYHTWQFNFEFDKSKDKITQPSLNLLEQCGIDFNKLKRNGIKHKDFSEYFMISGLVLNPDIHWISFHGSYDFGYLLKYLICTNLPETEIEFINLLDIYFINYYDIKTLVKTKDNLKIGLNKLAQSLEVLREGKTHQAGSDSVVTIDVYFKLIKSGFIGDSNIKNCKNLLFGINNEEDSKESREEIIGYKYEMFVEVKLRLLNLKHLGPTDIKTCYYNSKEINDWYTLEELNIADNTYVVCEYA